MKLIKLASNFVRMDINDISLWFSYETCVALMVNKKCFVSENVWSKSTGKHINQIQGEMVSRDQFLMHLRSIGNLTTVT